MLGINKLYSVGSAAACGLSATAQDLILLRQSKLSSSTGYAARCSKHAAQACCASIQRAAAALASLLFECLYNTCVYMLACTCLCTRAPSMLQMHAVRPCSGFLLGNASQQQMEQVRVFTTRCLKHSSVAVSWTAHPRSILLWSSLYNKVGLCMDTASTCRQACSCDYPAMLLTTCKHSLGVSLSAWLVTSCTSTEV